MNAVFASGAAREDDAAWASRLAEQLPAGDIRSLAAAAASGVTAVRIARGQAGAAVLRNTCDELLSRLLVGNPAYISGLLAGAGQAMERARRRERFDVVWTGPETGKGAGRLTAATIVELISQARKEILIVSYATHGEPAIDTALAAAADRGVEITIVAERHQDNPAYTATGVPFPGLKALRLRWPPDRRPPGASLHAKIIVVDDQVALVGSANFTTRAMESNLECGFLRRGGPEPRAIREHIAELQACGYLHRSPE
jgi:phosphatidylserine/phosphatidylglycerophosphate/cardiolipin synthase-like enzyme